MSSQEPAAGFVEPPARQRGRPPGTEPVADREAVIAAAVRAVRVGGLATTMDDIAAEADVTKPIVYRTVGDKAAIGAAVAEYLSLHIEDMTLALLHSAEAPHDRFKVVARAFFEFLAEERSLFLFAEHGWASQSVNQVEAMIDRSARPIMANFAKSNSAKYGSETLARTWAYSTVGTLRTVAIMWVREPYCELDELVEQVTMFVHRPMFPRGEEPGPQR